MELIKRKVYYNNKNNEIYIPSSKYLLILVNYNNLNNINLDMFSKKEIHTGILREVIWVDFWNLYESLNTSLDCIKDIPNDYIKLNYRLIDNNFKNRIIEIKRHTNNKKKYILKKWNGNHSCILLNNKKIIDFNLKKNNNDLFNIFNKLQNVLNDNNHNKLLHKNILKNKNIKDFFNKKIDMTTFNIPLDTFFFIDDIKYKCSISRIKWEYKTFLITILVSYKTNNVELLNNRLNNFCISPVNL